MIRLFLSPVILSLAACGPWPDLDEAVSPEAREAPAPELVPLDPALATVPEPRGAAEVAPGLAPRAEGLRARTDIAAPDAPSRAEIEARRARLIAERERLAP